MRVEGADRLQGRKVRQKLAKSLSHDRAPDWRGPGRDSERSGQMEMVDRGAAARAARSRRLDLSTD